MAVMQINRRIDLPHMSTLIRLVFWLWVVK